MADQLYLSLWFPNFRLESLPAALVSVLRQFALISGDKHVAAASTYPIGFNESAVYQRIYVNDERAAENDASLIENAVAEATEQLHDDMAYEFEVQWKLWLPEGGEEQIGLDPDIQLDALWRPEPRTVRVLGFGPEFDDGGYEQNGHIRVDFGLDYPWVFDDEDDPEADTEDASEQDPEAASSIRKNVEMLLAFTLSVEKHCGISSRLLWTESGEPLAEKLIARLQRLT